MDIPTMSKARSGGSNNNNAPIGQEFFSSQSSYPQLVYQPSPIRIKDPKIAQHIYSNIENRVLASGCRPYRPEAGPGFFTFKLPNRQASNLPVLGAGLHTRTERNTR